MELLYDIVDHDLDQTTYENDGDDMFYAELERRILVLINTADESDHSKNSRVMRRTNIYSSRRDQSYFDWTETENPPSSVPSTISNLWRSANANGTGVFIPHMVKAKRRNKNQNFKSKYYGVEEAREGSDSDLVKLMPTFDKKGEEMEERKKQIERGDVINLHDLLFTKNRDYLVKYNSDQRVKAEQLAGKVIVLFFVSLSDGNTGGVWGDYIRIHKDLYNDLKPENNYEIVFVGVNDYDSRFKRDIPDPHEYFEHLFSRMPWTAIPFSDIATRKRLQRMFGISLNLYAPGSFIVDSKGMVLFSGTYNVFGIYGTEGYPFSKEKIDLLRSEDDAAAKHPSLKTLLASYIRDYVISNTGNKVPIHTLEDKVVALYFYEDGLTDDRITERLKMAYYKLAKNNKNFEVVLIYLSDTYHTDCTNIESFWEKFKTMPWLALPFKDPNHKKLKRLFEYELIEDYGDDYAVPTLVIFGAHGEFINPHGVDMMLYADIQAYPFSGEKLANLEGEKVKELKMEMLLDPDTVCTSKDGSRIRLCQLVGKRVIFLFDKYRDGLAAGGTQKLLKDRYLHSKGSDDEFEVIHIVCHDNESMYNKLVADVPWLLHSFGYSFANELLPGIFGFHYLNGYDRSDESHSMIAFDQDGRVVRTTINPMIEDMHFPFYAGSVEEEAFSQLRDKLNWEYFDDRDQGIYSFKRTNQ